MDTAFVKDALNRAQAAQKEINDMGFGPERTTSIDDEIKRIYLETFPGEANDLDTNEFTSDSYVGLVQEMADTIVLFRKELQEFYYGLAQQQETTLRTCEYCGNFFAGRRSQAKYCSKACANAASSKRYRDRKRKESE